MKDIAHHWREYCEMAHAIARALRDADDADFHGSEAEAFHAQLYQFAPGRLDTIESTHSAVAKHIDTYGSYHAAALSEMEGLTKKAEGDHAAVQFAVKAVNQAEFALQTAIATANPMAISVAEANLACAINAHETALAIWRGDLDAAAEIKRVLGLQVDQVVASISAEPTDFSDSGMPGLGYPSPHIHLHIGRLTEVGAQLQALAGDVEDQEPLLKPLTGYDDVHGTRVQQATDTFKNTWLSKRQDIAEFIRQLGNKAIITAELFDSFDKERETQHGAFAAIINAMKFNPFGGTTGKVYIPDLGYIDENRGTGGLIPRDVPREFRSKWNTNIDANDINLYRNTGATAMLKMKGPKTADNTVKEKILGNKPNLHGVDYITEQGDTITRSADGSVSVLPLGRFQGLGVEYQTRANGTTVVTHGTRTTTYFPIAPQGVEVSGEQVLSRTFDQSTYTTTVEILRPDGTVIQKSQMGLPIYDLADGQLVPHYVDVGDPTVSNDFVNGQLTAAAPTRLINHPELGLVELADNPTFLDLQEHSQVIEFPGFGYGGSAQEHPGSFWQRLESVSDPLNKYYSPFGTGFGGLEKGLVSEAYPSKNPVMEATGIHMPGEHGLGGTQLPGKPDNWAHATKFAKHLGVAGDIVALGDGAFEAINTKNPDPFIVATGDVAGGAAGAYIGAAIGGLGGPLAPATVPLGGVVGAFVGSWVGGKLAEEGVEQYRK